MRFPMPSLAALVELHERMSLLARPAAVRAIALNTRQLDDGRRPRRDRGGRGRDGPAGRRSGSFGAAKLVDALLPAQAPGGGSKPTAAN